MGSHRAERGASTPTRAKAPTQPGGRRKATRRSTISRHPLTGLPILPTVAGAAAVAVAAGGALGAQTPASAETTFSAAKLNRLSAVAIEPVLDDRSKAISRDADRLEAEQDAEAELQEDVTTQAAARTVTLTKLNRSAGRQAKFLKLNQWHLPVSPSAYHLTARFGDYGLWSHAHTGLDFAADSGTEIDAVANGVITEVGWAGAYGYRTVETLDDGTVLWYCHQSATNVSVGEKVYAGQQIGRVGSTGHVTGPHLHLEVRPGDGDPVDPYKVLVYHGLQP